MLGRRLLTDVGNSNKTCMKEAAVTEGRRRLHLHDATGARAQSHAYEVLPPIPFSRDTSFDEQW